MSPQCDEPVICAGQDELQEELTNGRKKIKEIDGRLDILEGKVDVAIQHTGQCHKIEEFNLIRERLSNIFDLAKSTNDQILDMKKDQGADSQNLKERTIQNGKQDEEISKLKAGEGSLREDVAELKVEMSSLKDLMKTVISLLKAIGVGLIIFIASFFIKTLIFGI